MTFYFSHDTIRPAQLELANAVYDTIANKGQLLTHAPTGLGKTAAAISPAISYAIEHKKVVVFLTSRHTQHKIVLETIAKLKDKHTLNIRVSDLIAKKWMCAMEGISAFSPSEFLTYCKKTRETNGCDYYTNTREGQKLTVDAKLAVEQLANQLLSAQELKEEAKSRTLCPYEMGVELAKISHVIIGDYNYIFHPSIRDRFLAKIDRAPSDLIIIADEAHNLADRIKDMTTQRISTPILSLAIKEAEEHVQFEARSILQHIKTLLEIFSDVQIPEQLVKKEWLLDHITAYKDVQECIDTLDSATQVVYKEKQRSFIAGVKDFLVSWSGDDIGHIRVISKISRGIQVTYRCLDPIIYTKGILSQVHASIFMSGTLQPLSFYHDILGLRDDASVRLFPRPFNQDNALHLVVPLTTTKYDERTAAMYEDIARHCAKALESVPGNAAIFFPSYDILKSVNFFLMNICHRTIFTESSQMNQEDRSDMLRDFKATKNAVLLGVASGSFGEGIDMPGVLKCVIVVGLPLPKPDLETSELIKYYDARYQKGWDYGYIFPALNKTFQNAGRAIRSEHDRGVIMYLDKRFIHGQYKKCFPTDLNVKVTTDYTTEIEGFFKK